MRTTLTDRCMYLHRMRGKTTCRTHNIHSRQPSAQQCAKLYCTCCMFVTIKNKWYMYHNYIEYLWHRVVRVMYVNNVSYETVDRVRCGLYKYALRRQSDEEEMHNTYNNDYLYNIRCFSNKLQTGMISYICCISRRFHIKVKNADFKVKNAD